MVDKTLFGAFQDLIFFVSIWKVHVPPLYITFSKMLVHVFKGRGRWSDIGVVYILIYDIDPKKNI